MPEANFTPLPTKTQQQSNNSEQKPLEAVSIEEQNIKPIPIQNQQGFIRHKWAYIKFKRAIKKGNFVTASLTAKTLGVDRRTIQDWSNKPEIQRLLEENIDNYVNKIGKSKDWKAQAYLLDKVLDDDDKEKNKGNDLKQMIVINV